MPDLKLQLKPMVIPSGAITGFCYSYALQLLQAIKALDARDELYSWPESGPKRDSGIIEISDMGQILLLALSKQISDLPVPESREFGSHGKLKRCISIAEQFLTLFTTAGEAK